MNDTQAMSEIDEHEEEADEDCRWCERAWDAQQEAKYQS